MKSIKKIASFVAKKDTFVFPVTGSRRLLLICQKSLISLSFSMMILDTVPDVA
jgi:hypothetical protein